MKISPIDIRQHTFEKGFRGYNIDEVNAFLNSLSQEWERVMNDSRMLKMQLEIAEKELNKLKDVEMTLFRTLKTAEDTSSQITEQANKVAEKYLQESRQKSDETLNEAKRKASMLIQDAENEARFIKEEVINDLKNQERDFKAMEKYRDNLIVQLKSLVSTTNETVERFEKKFSKDSFLQRIEEIKQQVEGAGSAGTQGATTAAEEPTAVSEEQQPEFEIIQEETSPAQVTEPVVQVEEPVSDESDPIISEAPVASAMEVEATTATAEPEVPQEPAEPKEVVTEAAADEPKEEKTDAATEALAEVEKMVKARKSTLSLDKDKVAANQKSSSETESAGKGSFFDQIN